MPQTSKLAKQSDSSLFTFKSPTGETLRVPDFTFTTTPTGGDIPFSMEEIKKIEVTGPRDWTKSPNLIYAVYDCIKEGRSGARKFMDWVNQIVASYCLSMGMDVPFENADAYLSKMTSIPALDIPGDHYGVQDFFGPEPSTDLTDMAPLSAIMTYIGADVSVVLERVSREVVLNCAFAFAGLSARLATKPKEDRVKAFTDKRMSRTVQDLFPQLEISLLTSMIQRANITGFFDQIQVGTRWHTDHSIYMCVARDRTEGSGLSGCFAFFLVGSVGYQFTSFTTLTVLAKKLRVSTMRVLREIPLQECWAMCEVIIKRQPDLVDPQGWFLLCHSLSQKFKHEFSISVFPFISYICIYACEKLADQTCVPDMDIPGLNDLTGDDIITLETIGKRIAQNGITHATYMPIFDEHDQELHADLKEEIERRKAKKKRSKKSPKGGPFNRGPIKLCSISSAGSDNDNDDLDYELDSSTT